MTRRLLIRNHRSGDLLETFLVAAITGLLGIRFYLYLSHYPQVGGKSLHIAHMLYGGMLMFAGIVLLLGFLGYRLQRMAAAISGLGFGVFIDELGKFITRDNNYFFQPTVVVLYLLFITVYFLFRWLTKQARLSNTEYLMNALELMEEAVRGDMNPAEQQRIARYLKQADQQNPLTTTLQEFIGSVDLVRPKTGIITRLTEYGRQTYEAVIKTGWFATTLSTIFILDAIFALGSLTLLLLPHISSLGSQAEPVGLVAIGNLVASLVVAVFVVVGALQIRGSNLDAYEWFRRALLVDIFIKQPFLFYHDQFRAVFGLALYLLGLVTLNYMITYERSRERTK